MFYYLDEDTENMIANRSYKEIKESSKSLFIKPVDRKSAWNILDGMNDFTYSYKELSGYNPLIRSEMFDNKEVAFIKPKKSDNGVGVIMLGKFQEGKTNADELHLYLAKETMVDGVKGITAYKKLKETAGVKDVYKFGSSYYTSKQREIYGNIGEGKGITTMDNSKYEIAQLVRNFFSKADEERKSKEGRLLNDIKNDDFGSINMGAFYSKSDTWSIKKNRLTSGSMESMLFDRSQISGDDFAKVRTSPGETSLMSSHLNLDIWQQMNKEMRMNSSKNRSGFNKFYKDNVKDKGNFREMKKLFLDYSKKEFRENLSDTRLLKDFIGKDNFSDSYTYKEIQGIMNGNDYLNSKNDFLKLLEDTAGERSEGIMSGGKLNRHKFSKSQLNNLIDGYNKVSDSVFEKYSKKMNTLIDSKADKIINVDDLNKKYRNTPVESKESVFNILMADTNRRFFDAYNEKIDLVDTLLDERSSKTMSEFDMAANTIKVIRDKKRNVVGFEDVSLKKRAIRSYSKDDAEKAWLYKKARRFIGEGKFDSLTVEGQLQKMTEYKRKNKNLFIKHSKETLIGKYDTMDNFRKASNQFKDDKGVVSEMLTGTALNRTADKLIGSVNTDGTYGLQLTSIEKQGLRRQQVKLNIKLSSQDGYDKNDYIKYRSQNMQDVMKGMDLDSQKTIQGNLDYYHENRRNQKRIEGILRNLGTKYTGDEYDSKRKELKGYLSIMKGHGMTTKKYIDKDGKQYYGVKEGKEDYSDVYHSVIKNVQNNFGIRLDAKYSKAVDIDSESVTFRNIMNNSKKLGINDTVFNMIINGDDFINSSGSSKQSSLIHGDSYLGHLGFAQAGLAFNKITQRTYQGQDLLGEAYLNVTKNGQANEQTISALNASILGKTGVSGVGIKKVKHLNEEMFKKYTNRMRMENNLPDLKYRRGETYKTFAIGDMNDTIGKEGDISSFTASFQEGMTSTRSMKLTTNSVRNKKFSLSLDELDYSSLGKTKEQVQDLLKTKDGLDSIMSQVLDDRMYKTIKGKEKLSEFYSKIVDTYTYESLQKNGTLGDVVSMRGVIAQNLGVKNMKSHTGSEEVKRMAYTKDIMELLESANERLGAISLPKSRKGKVLITDRDNVKTLRELKPEVGLRIGSYGYNAQTEQIDLLIENMGSNDNGSKGQTTGAKFTVSEVYDFLKVETRQGKQMFIDAVFNNKTEKRKQTGMLIHSGLQTVFSNTFEDLGEKGVETLKSEMGELLKDLGVEVHVSDKSVLIDETYLTRNAKGDLSNYDDFMRLSTDKLENYQKLFTERGEKIIDKVTKKYGSSYYDTSGELKTGATPHFGILQEMNRAYTKSYDNFGKEVNPFMVAKAGVKGYDSNGETDFGKGNIFLMKLSSERVNSNANKKKVGGLKLGRESIEFMKILGYKELTDYIETTNQEKINDYLGGFYGNFSNADMLNKVFDNNKEINMGALLESVKNTTKNSVILDLNSMDKNDYLISGDDTFLSHHKLMENSKLGNAMKENGLDEVRNGKLQKATNVIFKDDSIATLGNEIKNNIDETKHILSKVNGSYGAIKDLDRMKNFHKLNSSDRKEFLDELGKLGDSIGQALYNSQTNGDFKSVYALSTTKNMVNLMNKNSDNDYALKQLHSIMRTGNLVSVMELGYDVSETDGGIVPSAGFTRIRNIAEVSNKYKESSKNAAELLERISKGDKSVIKDSYDKMKGYFNDGKGNVEDFKTFNKFVNEMDLSGSGESVETLGKISSYMKQRSALDMEKRSLRENVLANLNEYKKTNSEMTEALKTIDDSFKDKEEELTLMRDKIGVKLNTRGVEGAITGKFNHTVFGNDKLANGETFSKIYQEEVGEQTRIGFQLMDEYIKMPEEASSLLSKSGGLVKGQKFTINSSFTANPLEGSNLEQKFSNLMFEGANSVDDVKENLNQLGDFLGFKEVNDAMFEDADGMNHLDQLEISQGNKKRFQAAKEEARTVFQRNMSNQAHITITSKDYFGAFRDKNYDYRDLYDGKSIKDRGYTRELGFFARHPQQTVNHTGSVKSIVVDTDSKNLKNKFARATLTYLSKEKNQAGVITLGKKTMLSVRGDHDGDKVSFASFDFLEDAEIKNKTQARVLMEYQMKNNIFGEWDEKTETFKKLTGNAIDENGKMVDLATLDNPYKIIKNTIGIDKEEIEMTQALFKAYDFSIQGRAYKELGKHYNAVYDVLTTLSDAEGKYISDDNLAILEKVIKKSSDKKYHISKDEFKTLTRKGKSRADAITVGSNYARKNIESSLEVVDMLRQSNKGITINKRLLREKINSMDVIGSVALSTILKGESVNVDDLHKSSIKAVEKFLDRGTFDKFYSSKSSRGVFDELTGIRNTGPTHKYATDLRKTGIELIKMNPTGIISKLGGFMKRDMSIDELSEMARKQKYYSGASDVFFDLMIESAISAKHGLTLGGLEGSKIFIDSLLDEQGGALRNKSTEYFDKIFVNKDQKTFKEVATNMLLFKEKWENESTALEDIKSKVKKSGLDDALFMKSFDFDSKYYMKVLKNNGVSTEDRRMYSKFNKEYTKAIKNIDDNLFDQMSKTKGMNYVDFEFYKGMNLFGEMLISNEPFMEYDYKDLIKEINEGKMDSLEMKKIKNQMRASLGAAATVSNVGNMGKYINSFHKNHAVNTMESKYMPLLSEMTGKSRKDLNKYFGEDYEIIDKSFFMLFDRDKEGNAKAVVHDMKKDYKKLRDEFQANLSRNKSNAYAKSLNKNITLMSSSKTNGINNYKELTGLLEDGFTSLNSSTLSKGLDQVEQMKEQRINDIIQDYSNYDNTFKDYVDSHKAFGTFDKGKNLGMIQLAKRTVEDLSMETSIGNLRTLNSADILKDNVNHVIAPQMSGTYSMTHKELRKQGRTFDFINHKTKEFDFNSRIKALDTYLKNTKEKKIYFDESNLFFVDGKFSPKFLKSFIEVYEKHDNLYLGNKVAPIIVKNIDEYKGNIGNTDFSRIAEELVMANHLLGEEINIANAKKRLLPNLDLKLASRMKVDRFLVDNSEEFKAMYDTPQVFKSFKNTLNNNLESILKDFSETDFTIRNDNVDDFYINLAHTFTLDNKKYMTIKDASNSIENTGLIKKYSGRIKEISANNYNWLMEEGIDQKLFEKLSTMELANKIGHDETVDMSKIFRGVATTVTGKNYANKTFKTNKSIMSTVKRMSPKVGIAGLLGAAGIFVAKELGIVGKSEGAYILGKTKVDLTENEVLGEIGVTKKLEAPQGIKELVQGVNIPEYISIVKNRYF